MKKYSDIVMNNFRIFKNVKSIPQELEKEILSFLSHDDKNKFLNSIRGHFILQSSRISDNITPIKKKEQNFLFSHFSESNNKLNSYSKKFQRTKKTKTKKLFKVKRNLDSKFLKTLEDSESDVNSYYEKKYESIKYAFTKKIIYHYVCSTYDGYDYYGPIFDDSYTYIVLEDKNTYIFLNYEKCYYYGDIDFLVIHFELFKNMKYNYENIKIIKKKFKSFIYNIYKNTENIDLKNTLRQFII